jgi:hypothetical protein
MKSILSADQYTKWESQREKNREKMGERMERWKEKHKGEKKRLIQTKTSGHKPEVFV